MELFNDLLKLVRVGKGKTIGLMFILIYPTRILVPQLTEIEQQRQFCSSPTGLYVGQTVHNLRVCYLAKIQLKRIRNRLG